MARRCAATRSDGTACGNRPQKGSEFCRWHRAEAAPAALTGKLAGGARVLVNGNRVPGQAITAEEARNLTWYKRLLANVRGLAEENGHRLPLLDGEFTDQDSPMIIGAERLPLAALVRWQDDEIRVSVGAGVYSEIQVSVGLTAGGEGLEKVQAPGNNGGIQVTAEKITPNAVPIGAGAGRPFLGFAVLMGQFVVLAHEDVPRTADGLPDLRALWLTPSHWGELVTAIVPSPSRPPAPLPPVVRFPADRINKGAVEAFSHVRHWKEEDTFKRGYRPSTSGEDGFSMLCGLEADPGEAIWNFLLPRGETAIKAHFALWARMYEQTGGEPGEPVRLNVNQFCADLGLTPHKNGGFRPEQRQEAVRLLQAITSVEITVDHTVRVGDRDRVKRLSGPLWRRGLLAQEREIYADLFGNAGAGDKSLWDPVGFSYGPGEWFWNKDWRATNRYLGLIGAGLLKLRTDRDQVAIKAGGYLATLARIGQFRPRPVAVSTLLDRIGMADDYPEHPKRLRAAIEKAFARLVEVGVLAAWCYITAEDDRRQWREWVIEVEWPEELTRHTPRLEGDQAKRIEAAQRKALSPGRRGGRVYNGTPTSDIRRPHQRYSTTPPAIFDDPTSGCRKSCLKSGLITLDYSQPPGQPSAMCPGGVVVGTTPWGTVPGYGPGLAAAPLGMLLSAQSVPVPPPGLESELTP